MNASLATSPETGQTAVQTLKRIISEGLIRPHFQAIVDLFTGEIFGYEILSRGCPPIEAPKDLFELAERCGLQGELDRLCRRKALEKVALFQSRFHNVKYFLNVCPGFFADQKSREDFSPDKLRKLGIDIQRIVIEIPETASVSDYRGFEASIKHCAGDGFLIALDDFGAGRSSLKTLVASSPHFLKLDRDLISEIDRHSVKQRLVHSVASLSSDIGCKLIAEGVETRSELEVLVRLGVRYGQGFLMQKPQAEPLPLVMDGEDIAKQAARLKVYPPVSLDDSILNMALLPPTFEPKALKCEGLFNMFRENPSLDHVLIVKGTKPLGIVTRQHFYNSSCGPFGYSLVQKRPADEIAKWNILKVNEHTDLTAVGRLAMERDPSVLYDPVVVTDYGGNLRGTLTMKQILSKSINLEIKIATNANPLTNLPGNMMIQSWIKDAFAGEYFSLAYFDLDRFKEYNDTYGFAQGDEMIRLMAGIASKRLPEISRKAKLGHIGGDDLVIVASDIVSEKALQDLCREFDAAKLALFDPADAARGGYRAEDRQGREEEVPLVTLSIAVVTSDNTGQSPHPGKIIQIAAALKKKAKGINARTHASGVLFDRRRPGVSETSTTLRFIEKASSCFPQES